MANLKEVRTRIASVDSTRKITSAMKMVSASKLRRAQNAIQQMRPYAHKLHELLENLSGAISQTNHPLFTQREEVNSVLLVVISSNRGLCGSFNSNVIKQINHLTEVTYKEVAQNNKLHYITIGKRISEHVDRFYGNLILSQDELTESPSFEEISNMANMIMNKFAEGNYDKVEIVYHEFRNAASQVLITETYLPIKPLEQIEENDFPTDYIYQPDRDSITNDLVPKILKIQLFKALLDSVASEHGARMTAMHQATDNATELLKDLKLQYNKARQAAITTEILEIVSGAEALDN
ncbi:MAG: ATP synthase F1 subunit gamma [Bacteroidales bacterium]